MRGKLLGGAAILLALFVRLAIVGNFHASAGDGLQYFSLSQELAKHHRLAYSPDAPPEFSRLPGYPLFLAFIAVRKAATDLQTHLIRATEWNVLLDLGTALLVLLMARERRLGAAAGWAGFTLVIGFPLMIFLSCYGLSESLTTFLSTLELYLALRATRGGPRAIAWAAASGALAGAAQLTRVDGLAMIPAAVLAIAWAPLPRPRRLLALGAFALAGAMVFAPWPIRNLVQFHSPRWAGTEWIAQDGSPLPTGMMRWMRTWSTGAPGESYDLRQVANGWPLDLNRQNIILPQMYDDETEHKSVIRLFEGYNQERLSPAVDRGFRDLAVLRTRRHRLRTWLWLPLQRAVTLWKPLYSWELPMKSSLLNLPDDRWIYDWLGLTFLALGFAGAALLARRDRVLVSVVLLAVASRTAVHAWGHPFPVQRYLVEALPPLLLLAGYAVTHLFLRKRRAPMTSIAESRTAR